MNQNRTTTKKTEQRQTTRMQAPLGERQIVTELSEDFDLPDYRPEIKRLLRVQAKVSPADTYIGAGNAEFEDAAASTRKKLEQMHMPELDWFIDNMLEAFTVPIDRVGF